MKPLHIFMFLLVQVYGYAQQYRLEPLTSDIVCVATNNSHVVIGGTSGIFMLSNNEGESWKQLYLPENAVVIDISYSRNGVDFIALADSGRCFATDNNGKTWRKFLAPSKARCITIADSSKYTENYQSFAPLSRGDSTFIMYKAWYSESGVPNPIYMWKNNGKQRTILTVPTDHTHIFSISADTLFYSVPGELYRMILSPLSSVEEPKVEDYETSVFIQSPYPNPSSAMVHIPVWYYTKTVKPEDVIVNCYNIIGEKVADLSHNITRVSDGQLMAEWDMSDIPYGVYIVKSSSINRRGNARIIVKEKSK